MNKKHFLTLAAGIFTLFACSDPVVETDGYNSPIETNANLTVVVRDAISGVPLTDASVTFMSTNAKGAKVKDVPGVFVFKNVYVGSHNLLVEGGDGYATRVVTAEVDGDAAQNVFIANDIAWDAPLPPLTAGLEGYVYYQNKNAVDVPAVGVSVSLQFTGGDIVKKIYPANAVTDSTGRYVIDFLPAVSTAYNIVIEGKELGGIPFQTSVLGSNVGLSNGVVVKNSQKTILQEQNTAEFVVLKYNEVFTDAQRGTAVTFEFSNKVDIGRLVNDVSNPQNNSTIYLGDEVADITWSPDSTKLILTPVGKWKENFTIYLNKLRSATGKELTGEFFVRVNKIDLSKTSALKPLKRVGSLPVGHDSVPVNFTTTSTGLVWNYVQGAEGYYVYRQMDGEAGYTLVTTVNSLTGLDTVSSSAFSNPSNSDQIRNRTANFLIQPFNSQSRAKMDGVEPLAVQDNVKPAWSNNNMYQASQDTVTYFNGYDPNTFANAVLNYPLSVATANTAGSEWCLYFNEPMDTSAVDTEWINDNGNAAAMGRLQMKMTWSSNTYENDKLCMILEVKAGAVIATTHLKARFSITGLKDQSPIKGVIAAGKSGNPIEIKYTNLLNNATSTYNREKIVNNLDFRFITTMF